MRLALSLLALLGLHDTLAMKQSWAFEGEDRSHFLIERFGFGPSGRMDVSVSAVEMEVPEDAEEVQAGLLFVHQDELWETVALLDEAVGSGDLETPQASKEGSQCVLQLRQDSRWIDMTDAQTWNVSRGKAHVKLEGREGGAHNGPLNIGFYYIFYAQCTPGIKVSFHVNGRYVQEWSHRFFISGRRATSSVYLTTSLLFLGAAAAWGKCLATHREYVQRVHWLMALLVTVKTLALFAEAMRSYYMKRNGDTLTAWTAVAYAFLSLKGLLLFSVLMLIGTGWSLLKPHLSQRDKSVLSLVLVLQVVSNIAQILESETAVGTRAWVGWRDVLILADVACCAAVLLPIVWSIRELRVAATTDGKAFYNLQKLTQFRSFYLLVITYIYVTRLVLQLLQASLPYDATWIAVAVMSWRPWASSRSLAIASVHCRSIRILRCRCTRTISRSSHWMTTKTWTSAPSNVLIFASLHTCTSKTKASYSTKSTSSLDRSSNAKKRSGSVNSDL
ncbi:Lung seven transmembrane receptor-like [Phytophthora cactorum]|nr:Lung seven transmembrane receptor-like [Phytophthora cactorum]